jgi:preprotein translocase subunit YajC
MGTQMSVPPKGGPPQAGQSPNPIMSFFPMVVVILILYALVIRPQQKQAKAHRILVDNLKAGDRVLTQGGIYGTVTALKGAIIQVKIADNVRIDIARTAISQVLRESTNGSVIQPAPERVG